MLPVQPVNDAQPRLALLPLGLAALLSLHVELLVPDQYRTASPAITATLATYLAATATIATIAAVAAACAAPAGAASLSADHNLRLQHRHDKPRLVARRRRPVIVCIHLER